MSVPERPDFAAALAAAARSMHNPQTLDDALQRIVEAARDTIPGFDHVGLSTVDKKQQLATRATTTDLVTELDGLQYGLREGPCVETMTSSTSMHIVPHIRHEQRWPTYVPQAVRRGLRSQMAIQLHVEGRGPIGGLNLYSTESDEIHPEAQPLAEAFAAHSTIALADATRFHHLNEALISRKTIGQAIGIVMERYDLDEDSAFAFLIRAASTSNIKLRDVARELIEQKNKPQP